MEGKPDWLPGFLSKFIVIEGSERILKRLHVIYNPYRVSTMVRFLRNNDWVTVDEFSRLSWVQDKRIQRWLFPDARSSWKGFFAEAVEISGSEELDVSFTGTYEDYDDMCSAAKQFWKDGVRANMHPYGDRKNGWENSSDKLNLLRQEIIQAQKSTFWRLLPAAVCELLENALKPIHVETSYIHVTDVDVKKLHDCINRSARGAIVFCVPDDVSDQIAVKEKLKLMAGAIRSLGSEAVHGERYFFLCETENDPDATIRDLRMAFLECGLNSTNLYVRSPVRTEREDDLDAGLSRYYKRFSDQVLLECLCEEVVRISRESGVMDKDFRESIGVSFGEAGCSVSNGLSAGFSVLGRLRDHLVTWASKNEMAELCGRIRYEISRRSIRYPDTKDADKPVGADEALICYTRFRPFLQTFLQEACSYAMEQLDVAWGDVYVEFVDQYFADESNTIEEIPKFIEPSVSIAPVDAMNDLRIEGDIEEAVKQRTLTRKQFYAYCRQQALMLFDEWLDECAVSMINQVEDVRRIIEQRLSDGTKADYREQVRSEARMRSEADSWLKEFVENINHLLDIEAEVRKDD